MNAEAYLRKQGWQGSGHSLDQTGRGIKRPLLIAHKNDQLGLGKKKAAHTTDDQWWLRAFDQSLQSIGTGKDSTLDQIRTQGIYRGGLYGFFVKGELIGGTIGDSSATTTDVSNPASGTSTPPTSASDTETPAPTKEKSDKKNKRKREEAHASTSKKSKKVKDNTTETKDDQKAVARKLAKLKPADKADYETRAKAKGQTLDQYVLRRIQKKTETRSPKPVEVVKEKKQKSDKMEKKIKKAAKA
jgi:nucleolar protein TMA23